MIRQCFATSQAGMQMRLCNQCHELESSHINLALKRFINYLQVDGLGECLGCGAVTVSHR